MKFNKFKDKNKKNKGYAPQEQVFTRVKLPKPGELLGIVEQRYGGAKMLVKCSDKISRNCRVPGRLKRKLWLREGDIVLVQPWEFDKEKADIIFKYNPSAINWLRNKGYLKELKQEF